MAVAGLRSAISRTEMATRPKSSRRHPYFFINTRAMRANPSAGRTMPNGRSNWSWPAALSTSAHGRPPLERFRERHTTIVSTSPSSMAMHARARVGAPAPPP